MSDTEKEIRIKKKISKAKVMYGEIKNLISFGYYDTSLNRLYYSCFYCVHALLAKIDLYPKTHKGVIITFNKHYVKPGSISKELGRFYQDLFEQRMLADYSDSYEISKETVDDFASTASQFIAVVENLLENNK